MVVNIGSDMGNYCGNRNVNASLCVDYLIHSCLELDVVL